MKYIKLFENYNDIDAICRKYNIENYTINEDGTIDVDDDVYLRMYELYKLPLKFNIVSGNFNCSANKLISLEGCPKYVGGTFDCEPNKLISLEGCPKYVGSNFYCGNNNLMSLKGCPENISINFYCNSNQLTTLKYFPEVQDGIYIHKNPLPVEIYENKKYLKDIIKNQYEYRIWNKDDSLNIPRFEAMMEEIKNN